MLPPCDHYWVSGDLWSDWICANCGARENIPDWEDKDFDEFWAEQDKLT